MTGAPGRRAPRARPSAGALGRRAFPGLLWAALALVLAFLVLPLVAIFVDVPPRELLDSLDDPVATDALRLSLETSALALALILLLGTPAAWVLATRRFPGRSLAITLVELPLVVPPAVAGIGLLAALGPHGLAGGALHAAGITLVLQTSGVVVALAFVASPFYVRQAIAAFEGVDPRLLEASRTLGAGEARTLVRIAIPVARPALAAGAALAWGRALGEFGATLMFAGSFRGITQTAPLAIYERFAADFPAALALSAVLVALSGALLLTAKLAGRTGTDAAG
jgi:molybdate transport system permease protein